jgi:SRSO17 transposase
MTGGVTAGQIEGWGGELAGLLARTDSLFTRPEPRARFADFVKGLLSPVQRKNGWQLAERAGHLNPDAQQWLLNGAKWSADALRDVVREYVVERLSADGAGQHAVLVADDTAALKKGAKSVGVSRQRAGITGQIENCQVMTMLTYATDVGHAFIDRRLYLPKSWTQDASRLAEAGVPAEVVFATKPQQAISMLAATIEAGVPFEFFTADADYGHDPGLRAFCHDHAVPYVLAIPVSEPIRDTGKARRADDFTAGTQAWERRSCGHGTKGERFYDWAFHAGITLPRQSAADGFAFTLLIRRSVSDPAEIRYFLAHAPQSAPVPRLIQVAGLRWTIEECNEQGKDDVGLDHYEVRKWEPWHRHVTACMLALAYLAAVRAAELGKESRSPEHAC